MEFWSIQMDISLALGNIQTIRKGMRNCVSHLLYANDMLVFLRANKKSALQMNSLLHSFGSYTGLNINRKRANFFW